MNYQALENAEFSRVLLCMKGFKIVHHLAGTVCSKSATSFILRFWPKFAKVHQTYTIFAEIAENVKKSHIFMGEKVIIETYILPNLVYQWLTFGVPAVHL